MSTQWPSQTLSTARPTKGRSPKAVVPTDWVTGWIVTALAVVMVAGIALVLWPIVANALDSVQSITRILGGA